MRLDGGLGQSIGIGGGVADLALHLDGLQVWVGAGGRSWRPSGHCHQTGRRPSPISADGPRTRQRRMSSPGMAERGYARGTRRCTRLGAMRTLRRARRLAPASPRLLLAILLVAARRLRLRSGVRRPPAAPSAPRPASPRATTPTRSVGIDLPAPSERSGARSTRSAGSWSRSPASSTSARSRPRRCSRPWTAARDADDRPTPAASSPATSSIRSSSRGADAKTFAITLREGHGPGDVVCIEIAESKRRIVDLGELAPGHVHHQRQRPVARHRSRSSSADRALRRSAG